MWSFVVGRSGFLLVLLAVIAHGVSGEVLTGIVNSATSETVTIVLASEQMPQVEDPVRIYTRIPGVEEEMTVGSGHVTAVQAGVVTALITTLDGYLQKDQLASIDSSSPVTGPKSSPTPKAEQTPEASEPTQEATPTPDAQQTPESAESEPTASATPTVKETPEPAGSSDSPEPESTGKAAPTPGKKTAGVRPTPRQGSSSSGGNCKRYVRRIVTTPASYPGRYRAPRY